VIASIVTPKGEEKEKRSKIMCSVNPNSMGGGGVLRVGINLKNKNKKTK
jgi:hypothetical protein